jgi:hypothetical protein
MHDLPFLPLDTIFMLTISAQTDDSISMAEGSNDVFLSKEVLFGVLVGNIFDYQVI